MEKCVQNKMEIQNWCAPLNVARLVESCRFKWAGLVSCSRERGMMREQQLVKFY